MRPVERILVVGGGIGGLAIGAALAQRRFEVQIVERKPEFDVHGVGLGQPANALRALRALGVLDQCIDAGFSFEHFKIYDHQRNLIIDHRLLLGDESVPAAVALPRRDLHRILLGAAEAAGCKIALGAEPVELAPKPNRIDVYCTDGTVDSFDLVIGFDGYTSWTRRQLFGDSYDPVYSGSAAWRLIVDRPPEVTCMEFYQGLGHKTGVMPLTTEAMYLFHIRPEPGNPWQDPSRLHVALRERLANYRGVAAQIRDQLSAEHEITYSPLATLFVTRPWYRGRVVIAGDAAHTYPPHMTQGAAMALEDALVLAEELDNEGPLDDQLETFMRRREHRCRYVNEFANRMLRDEQKIKTRADLERARHSQLEDFDARLSAADRLMDEEVLVTSDGPTRTP